MKLREILKQAIKENNFNPTALIIKTGQPCEIIDFVNSRFGRLANVKLKDGSTKTYAKKDLRINASPEDEKNLKNYG